MTEIRPLRPHDVPAADETAWSSLRTMAARYDPAAAPWPERTAERVERGRHRIAHLQRTDPGGSWVAAEGDAVLGVALALRRGPLWFLSLLAVATDRQAAGIGKALLTAALVTAEGAGAGWIMASPDPKALRRYALAGFAPHAGYAATGPLDRSLLPADLGVRDGDLGRDRALVEQVVTGLRGSPYGPDLDAMVAAGAQLLVAEDGPERGFCWYGARGIVSLGATTVGLAQRLLWEALGRSEGPEASIDALTADQQWAIEVALAARLPLHPGGSSCRRGALGPLTPYLPGGAYG